MVKYYFFVTKKVLNDSGQYRTFVYPLPGQTTYVSYLQPNEPVDENKRVQLELRENSKACSCPVGTVIGVRLESNVARDLRLVVHSRNGSQYYRCDSTIYQVENLDFPVGSLPLANEEMLEAYRVLCGQGGASDFIAPVTEDVASANEFSISRYTDAETKSYLATVIASGSNELKVIEDTLLRNESESRANNMLLQISMLLDRMRKGIAKFSFFKQNGEHRQAYGTRNESLIQALGGERFRGGSLTNTPDGTHVPYYDIQRHAWRCFCVPDFDALEEDFLIIESERAEELARETVEVM